MPRESPPLAGTVPPGWLGLCTAGISGTGHVPRLRSRWRAATAGWLRLPISLALLALIVSQVGVAGSLQVIGNADPAALLVTLVLFLADRVFAGLRWHLLARLFSPEADRKSVV